MNFFWFEIANMIILKKIKKKIFLLAIVYIKWQCDFFYMDNLYNKH